MNQPIPFKRGDSFLLTCTYKDNEVATAISLSTTIEAQLRDAAGVLVEDLVVQMADQDTDPGRFDLLASVTDDWPLGKLRCDIQFTTGATIQSTQVFAIQVSEGVTQ